MVCELAWDDKVRKSSRPQKQVTYTMTYPSKQIQTMKFESSEDISKFLLHNAQEIGYCKWQLFEKTLQDKGDYIKISYICRYKMCDAKLIYKQKIVNPHKQSSDNGYQKKYYLKKIKIDNLHNHMLKLTRRLVSEGRIRQYLFDLSVQERFEAHIEVVKQKFKLTRCQAKYLKDRVFWRFKNEDHMLRKLTQRRVLFRRDGDQQISPLLLLVSETMKKNYQKYGDNLAFDITYKLLMRKKDDERYVGVGFFVGQDENIRITLFGLCTIRSENTENFMKLFSFFFDLVGGIPESIVTDDQKAIGFALDRLKAQRKYKFVHMLDWYHKIQASKKLIKRESNQSEIMTLFTRMLKEPSRQIFSDMIYEIAGLIEREGIVKEFLKQRERCCLSQAPERFFGFGISSTRVQAFNNLIKRSVPHQTNMGRLIFFVLRVEKRLINRMAVLNYIHSDLITFIDDPQICYLQNVMQCLPFEQIRQYYEESRSLQIIQGKQPHQRYVPYKKYERNYRFNLMYDLKYGCWRCECRNNFRTGIPCPHLFKVIREYGGCIGYYINQRWIHNKDNAVNKKPYRPDTKRKRI